jgi:succinyl-diaminopimelate desuccinylase
MVINTCEKGTVWLEIETHGKSIHASKADLGVNASVEMAKVILAAERLRFDVARHRLLGLPVVASATTIQGGVKTNIVPDRCRATFDVRFPPGLTSGGVVGAFQRMVEELRAEDPRLDASVKVLFQDEALDVPEDEEIVRVAKNAWREYYREEPRISGFLAGTDMKVFAEAKIPCLVALGPGLLEVAHTIDEFVDVKQLEDAAKVYALMALEYLGADARAG